MKVGIVRGPFLGPWDCQSYEKLKKFGIQPVGFVSENIGYDISKAGFEIVRLKSAGSNLQVGKLRLVEKLFQGTSLDLKMVDNYLLGFKKAVADMDVLHAPDPFFIFSYQCVRSGKPTVITMWENIPFLGDYAKPQSDITVILRKNAARFKNHVKKHADHFVPASERAANALKLEGVPEEKISIIPAGVDREKFKPMEKDHEIMENMRISKAATTILFAGRLVWEKGILDVLYAMANLLKERRDIYLLIIGAGPLKDSVERLVGKLRINDNCRFLGPIGYDQMPKYHNLADIFCLPSIPIANWQEQFGYVFVEAMACEKPVVSTLSGSIPEVVANGKTGLLVQPADSLSLAEALNTLITDERKRKQMGSEGRNRFLEKFEAEKVAGQLAEVYKKVV